MASKVAVGISQGGSEDAQLNVYEAATGKQIAGPIDRAQFGATAWSDDSKMLYFIRLKKVAKGDEINKYKNVTVELWDLKSEPVAVARQGLGQDTDFDPDEFPTIEVSPESPIALRSRSTACRTSSDCGWRRPRARAARARHGNRLPAATTASRTSTSAATTSFCCRTRTRRPSRSSR